MKQDVRTIHPMDMRDHGIKVMGGHLLKAQVLLDRFMKQLHGPAEPVPHDNLTCRSPQIIAGKILAATIRSIAQFGTHQLDLAHIAQIARGVSDANVHSLTFIPIRRQTNGVPLEPAMTTEKRVNVAPLLRCGGGQRERFRFDAARCPQGHNEVPAFIGNGILDLFVIIATIGQHQDLTPIIGTNIVRQVKRAKIFHHVLVFTLIREIMRLAVPLAIEGDRPQRNQHITENEDDIGPLMTDDIPLAVIERLGVFRVQTGTVLQRTVDQDQDLPGQAVDSFERFGKLPGLCFGEILQRGDGHLGMRFQ